MRVRYAFDASRLVHDELSSVESSMNIYSCITKTIDNSDVRSRQCRNLSAALTVDQCHRHPGVDDGPDDERPAGRRDVRVVLVRHISRWLVK